MRSFAIAFILFSFAALPVAAADKSPKRGDKLTASEVAAFKAITAEEHPTPNLADLRAFTMAAWPHAPQSGLFVAAMGNEVDNFDVAILKAKGSDWAVVTTLNTDNDLQMTADVLTGLELDMIPYRISKDEVAFGVRSCTAYNSTSVYAGGTTLHLFRLHKGKLEDIFSAVVSSSAWSTTRADDNADDNTDKENISVVQFTSTQHGGYYDIILKPSKGSVGKTIHYIWNDGHYADKDKPEIEQSNE